MAFLKKNAKETGKKEGRRGSLRPFAQSLMQRYAFDFFLRNCF